MAHIMIVLIYFQLWFIKTGRARDTNSVGFTNSCAVWSNVQFSLSSQLSAHELLLLIPLQNGRFKNKTKEKKCCLLFSHFVLHVLLVFFFLCHNFTRIHSKFVTNPRDHFKILLILSHKDRCWNDFDSHIIFFLRLCVQWFLRIVSNIVG